jgi:hypothetical protein
MREIIGELRNEVFTFVGKFVGTGAMLDFDKAEICVNV